MKFALRRREGELTALLSTAVSTGPIYPRLGNYVYLVCHGAEVLPAVDVVVAHGDPQRLVAAVLRPPLTQALLQRGRSCKENLV